MASEIERISMVLSKEKLNELMPISKQEEEIKRIKSAPEGMVLFTSFVNDIAKENIYETLLSLAGCKYHRTTWLSRGKTKWVKGTHLFNYGAA